jgi:signal transduction histidine kinase
MNIFQFDNPNKVLSSRKKIFSGDDSSKSLEKNYVNSNTGVLSEKNLITRLQEMERLNSSLEILLEHRTAKLTEIISTNGKFLTIIAHDLRSPFSSIIGILELLKMNLKELTKAEIEEYVEIGYKSANNTLVLLDNLLVWAVSQNKEKNFKPIKINLLHLLRQEIESLKTLAGQKSIVINDLIDEEINVTPDLQMIKTILRNLISNAIKYTNANGEITINAHEINQYVEISVKDNGIGMSHDVRKKLFKIDYLHSIPGTNDEKGTGLGLLLCKEFVELHGGNISIESETGKGSTFAFTVPHYL